MAANRREFLKVAAGTAVTAGLPLDGARSLSEATQRPAADVRDKARARGLNLAVVNPQNFGMGSFEGIWIDPDTDQRRGRDDTRRCAMAEAV